MLKSFFRIAYRNLLRNKTYSFINIGGLAIGMAVAMLIGLWIYDELSYDTVHSHYDRIAKIRQHVNVNGNLRTEKTVPFPLAATLRTNYSNYFKYVVLSSHRGGHILATGDKKLTQYGVYLEPEAPRMLTLKMLSGSIDGLNDPSSVFISAATANAFFGNGEAINEVISIDGHEQVKVAGVYEDLPANATFANVKFIAPFALYLRNAPWVSAASQDWDKDPVQAYVQLADGVDMDKVSSLISQLKMEHSSKEKAAFKPSLFLEPMSKWHLYEEYKNGVNTGGRIRYVWIFGIIGVFVLLLACINFMNLSTARSEKRAKEVGVHKAIGSLRRQLIIRFYCEALLVAALAFVVSLLIVQGLLPFFNEVAAKKLNILWRHPLFWTAGIGFSILTAVIAGSYPALYLSSFNAVHVLKGTFRIGWKAAIPRKALVVVQFTVSVALIICTIVVLRQVQYAKDRPIGYNSDGLLIIPAITPDIAKHFDALKDGLIKSGAVTSIAAAEGPTTDVWGSDVALSWKGKDPNTTVDFPITGVSVDYGKTVGWQVTDGRDFSLAYAGDSASMIVNEAAVKYMGLQHPVGEVIRWGKRPYTIAGVVKDVITESPYEMVRPALYWRQNYISNFVYLRVDPSVNIVSALTSIESIFRQYNPAAPFEYKFVDEEYGRKFGSEERVGKLAGFFAVLAILISCLGLFGLASFVAEQRTKEIGIRKVLGASLLSVWTLLSKEFVWLVIIALLIAVPVSYYCMYQWLQNYTWRSDMSWWIFAASAAGAILITLFTVSFQAIKAALINPAKSLKSE